MKNEYAYILSNKYYVDKMGRFYITDNGREVKTKINNKNGIKSIRLYDRSKDRSCKRTTTFNHARLLYYAFNQYLDYDDKSWQVKIKTNNSDYTLDDLELVRK